MLRGLHHCQSCMLRFTYHHKRDRWALTGPFSCTFTHLLGFFCLVFFFRTTPLQLTHACLLPCHSRNAQQCVQSIGTNQSCGSGLNLTVSLPLLSPYSPRSFSHLSGSVLMLLSLVFPFHTLAVVTLPTLSSVIWSGHCKGRQLCQYQDKALGTPSASTLH